MKSLQLIVMAILSSLGLYAQTRESTKKANSATVWKLLEGEWTAEHESEISLNFRNGVYVARYGEMVTHSSNYVLSFSCKTADKIPPQTTRLDKTVYLLLYDGNEVEQCYELLGVSNTHMSWMNTKNGKLFIYLKQPVKGKR